MRVSWLDVVQDAALNRVRSPSENSIASSETYRMHMIERLIDAWNRLSFSFALALDVPRQADAGAPSGPAQPGPARPKLARLSAVVSFVVGHE